MTRRRKTISCWAVAVLAMLLVPVPQSAVAETIRISGTGGATGTIRILAEAFRKTAPGIRIDILPSMGSNGSIKAVQTERLDIGLSARTLTDEERGKGVTETRYARTPFVFAANKTLSFTGLTLEGVAAIYAGKRDWEKGNRIRLVRRSRDDTDFELLKSMSPGMSAAVDISMRRKGMIVATTDHDAADAIESVPGGFGATTLSLVLSEKRDLRVISLDGIMPSVQTMASRSYPFVKTFFIVTRKNPSASVRRFIDFVRSPTGSAILAKNGQAAAWEDGTTR